MVQQTVILGGGIVGMTLALSLALAKHRVVLIDTKKSLTVNGWQSRLQQRDARVYALSHASIELLRSLGVWQKIVLSGRKVDFWQMQVWQQDGMGEINFSDQFAEQTNVLGSMVEPLVLEKALIDGCMDEKVRPFLTYITGQSVSRLDWLGESLGYQVILDDRQKFVAKLLIGADGRQSMVRQFAQISQDFLDYQQMAICCAIKTKKPHQAIARQVFLPTGSLALLPLADIEEIDKQRPQHWQSVVWTLPKNLALDLLTLSEGDLAKELAFASGYVLGDIEVVESVASFTLTAQHAKQYVKPNLALVGDSAHGVHPLAGQGLNLGMLDIIALLDCLHTDFKRTGKTSWANFATLQRYQRQRYAHNALMMHSFSGLNWLFTTKLPLIQSLRSAGFYQVSRLKPLLKFFVQQANGIK